MRYEIRNELKKADFVPFAEFSKNRMASIELFPNIGFEFILVGSPERTVEDFGYKLYTKMLFE